MKTIRNIVLGLATASAVLPAAASAQEGRWQVKAFISGVLPDAKVTKVDGPAAAAMNGSNVDASDNWVPTLALEYFVTDKVSIETICCATGHHMTGTGALAGVPLVEKAVVMPGLVSAKYHFALGPVRPYIGAGPALALFPGKRTSAALKAMGLVNVDIPAKVGAAVQAGFDVPLNDKGLSFSMDAKRFFVRPTARFKDSAGDVLLRTTHKLDPWVVSAGFGLRF